jgi:hypothetical protein
MKTPEPEQIVLSRLRAGPIRHQSLAPELLARIAGAHRLIGKFIGVNLEQFEIGFMRNETPEVEIAMWCGVAAAWDDFHRKFIGEIRLPDGEVRNLIAALIAISLGQNDVTTLPVPVEVGRKLMECYDGLAGA